MQGSARKDVVFGAARGYTFTVPGPKWKSWLGRGMAGELRRGNTINQSGGLRLSVFNGDCK